MKLLRFIRALTLAFGNHFIAHIPSFLLRTAYYRHVLRYRIARDSHVHMGCFFTGGDVSIGPHSIVNRNCFLDGRKGLRIGKNCSISSEVMLLSMGHDPQSPGFEVNGGCTTVGDHAWVGSRAILLPGVTVGEGAVIGAGSVVTKDIRPWMIAAGNPAREIKARNRDLTYTGHYRTWFDTDLEI